MFSFIPKNDGFLVKIPREPGTVSPNTSSVKENLYSERSPKDPVADLGYIPAKGSVDWVECSRFKCWHHAKHSNSKQEDAHIWPIASHIQVNPYPATDGEMRLQDLNHSRP